MPAIPASGQIRLGSDFANHYSTDYYSNSGNVSPSPTASPITPRSVSRHPMTFSVTPATSPVIPATSPVIPATSPVIPA